MKKTRLITATLCSLVCAYSLAAAAPDANSTLSGVPEGSTLINQTIAIVNNGVISQIDLDTALAQAKIQITQNNLPMPNDLSLQRQVLHQLIIKKALLELAALRNITVDDAQVNSQIAQVALNNNLTVDQLKQAIAAQGIDYNAYWTNIQQQLIVTKLEQIAVVNSIQITPDEVNTYLTAKAALSNPTVQYHIEHILLPLPSNPTASNLANSKQQAEQLVQKINAGLPFSKAAMEYSQSDDALQGGDLGFKTADALPTIFTGPVQTMQVGQVYGPIQTDTGFHIIKLVDKRTPAPTQHFVQQTHVLAILIKTSPIVSDSKAQALLNDLRSQLTKGASFAKLAQANSEDLKTASNGGDMGWVTDSQVNPTFASQMDSLSINAISQPFQTPDGWYLIQVTGRRQQDDTANYERMQAEQTIFEKKAQAAVINWQNIIVGDSYIEILIPDLVAAMPPSTDNITSSS